ncbi:MAG: replication-associated recombination protein A [Thermodesulfobacteriota bacterium]
MDLFEYQADKALGGTQPLAERMRPKHLGEFVGQLQIAGENGLIRNAIEKDRIFSMILWGPPGCGKTTLAAIIAGETRSHFIQISAVLSGVKEIREVIEEARRQKSLHQRRTILFVDEIHRFNKSQQDAFLQHVENGLITLIGATTENPSFEVIPALLSRCRVVVLEPLSSAQIREIMARALTDPERGLGQKEMALDDDAAEHLAGIADGDVRCALNALEIAVSLASPGSGGDRRIRLADVEKALLQKALRYDKSGEEHYNIISAFHKSMRGSDPDAAAYWLRRMLAAGEDPMYVARRMVRFASEDVGNADPYALQVALNAAEAFRFLGHPEGDLALVQAAVYLATAPKSNSLYVALGEVDQVIAKTGSLAVPLHIRNAPTRLMKELGYGRGYQYAHDFEQAYVPQSYLPGELEGTLFYNPTDRGYEKTVKQRLDKWRALRAGGNEKKEKKAEL